MSNTPAKLQLCESLLETSFCTSEIYSFIAVKVSNILSSQMTAMAETHPKNTKEVREIKNMLDVLQLLQL